MYETINEENLPQLAKSRSKSKLIASGQLLSKRDHDRSNGQYQMDSFHASNQSTINGGRSTSGIIMYEKNNITSSNNNQVVKSQIITSSSIRGFLNSAGNNAHVPKNRTRRASGNDTNEQIPKQPDFNSKKTVYRKLSKSAERLTKISVCNLEFDENREESLQRLNQMFMPRNHSVSQSLSNSKNSGKSNSKISMLSRENSRKSSLRNGNSSISRSNRNSLSMLKSSERKFLHKKRRRNSSFIHLSNKLKIDVPRCRSTRSDSIETNKIDEPKSILANAKTHNSKGTTPPWNPNLFYGIPTIICRTSNSNCRTDRKNSENNLSLKRIYSQNDFSKLRLDSHSSYGLNNSSICEEEV